MRVAGLARAPGRPASPPVRVASPSCPAGSRPRTCPSSACSRVCGSSEPPTGVDHLGANREVWLQRLLPSLMAGSPDSPVARRDAAPGQLGHHRSRRCLRARRRPLDSVRGSFAVHRPSRGSPCRPAISCPADHRRLRPRARRAHRRSSCSAASGNARTRQARPLPDHRRRPRRPQPHRAAPRRLRRAIDIGVTHDELVEVITHLAFYSGLPTAIGAVGIAKRSSKPVDGAPGQRLLVYWHAAVHNGRREDRRPAVVAQGTNRCR